MKKYFIIYKITNTQTNKFYIGAHETYDKDDDYMGSGVYLKRAQKKYGMDAFVKEIICECETREEMYVKESEIIEINENSYNIMNGGHGGWSYARSKITSESYEKVRATMTTDDYREKTKHHRKNSAKRLSDMQKDPMIRQRQAETLSKKMNDPLWKETTGKLRSQKIAETLKLKSAEFMTDERNKKVSDAMKGRICVSLHGVKKRLKIDDPLLNHPDIILGWK